MTYGKPASKATLLQAYGWIIRVHANWAAADAREAARLGAAAPGASETAQPARRSRSPMDAVNLMAA